jgi:hypothetical protein
MLITTLCYCATDADESVSDLFRQGGYLGIDSVALQRLRREGRVRAMAMGGGSQYPIFGTIGVWDMVMQRFHSQFLAGAIAAGAFAALSFLSWRVFLRLRISKKSPKA